MKSAVTPTNCNSVLHTYYNERKRSIIETVRNSV